MAGATKVAGMDGTTAETRQRFGSDVISPGTDVKRGAFDRGGAREPFHRVQRIRILRKNDDELRTTDFVHLHEIT